MYCRMYRDSLYILQYIYITDNIYLFWTENFFLQIKENYQQK